MVEPFDMWEVGETGTDVDDADIAAPPPLRVHGPLIATPIQRFRYRASSRAAISTVAVIALAASAGGLWANRNQIESRLSPPAPAPTITVSPDLSPTPTPSSLSPEQNQTLIKARSQLNESIAAAEQARASADGKDTSGVDLALEAARSAVVKADAGRMDETRAILDNAVAALTAPDPAPAVVETPEPAPVVETPTPEPVPVVQTPDSVPVVNPPAPVSQRATTSLSVTCSAPATVAFTASGGGTVTLSAGGQSASGAGSAALNVVVEGTVSATASADQAVSANFTWASSTGAKCR